MVTLLWLMLLYFRNCRQNSVIFFYYHHMVINFYCDCNKDSKIGMAWARY